MSRGEIRHRQKCLCHDGVRLRRDEGDALAADEVRAGDAVQHRPQLILHRRPAVGLVVQLTYPVGRLTDRLRDVVERTDDVDRRLQDRIGRLYSVAQRSALHRRQRRHFADLRASRAGTGEMSRGNVGTVSGIGSVESHSNEREVK
ncbi:MAG TPA: hypothetical protein VF713_00410 [Thermoanaerobaculia bacterium]